MSYEHPRAWIDDGAAYLKRDAECDLTEADYMEDWGGNATTCDCGGKKDEEDAYCDDCYVVMRDAR